jgi:MFS superfamily sulfate permease-like transporter
VFTLMFLMPLFKNLPVATLGAIVIQAILGLSDFSYMNRLFGISVREFAVAMVALFGVLSLSVLHGIGLGVVLALVLLIYRASYPGTAVLGQLAGEDHFRDLSRNPEAQTYPGLLIFRFDNSLFYANANYFGDQVKRHIEESTEPVREVLIDCEMISLVDTTGASALIDLIEELGEQEIRISLARVRDDVRQRMRLSGVEKALGEQQFHDTLTHGVTAFQEHEKEEHERGPA